MNFKQFYQVNRMRFILLVIVGALTPALNICNTYVIQLETDIVLAKKWNQFLLITLLALVILVVSYILNGIALYDLIAQEQDLNHQVRTKIVDHYYYDNQTHDVAKMQSRLTNDLEMLNQNYFGGIIDITYGVVTILAVVIYLSLLSWQLLLVIFLMVGISLLLPKLTEKPLQKATNLISDANQKYLDTLNDWLSGLEQIQQFLAGPTLFKVSSKASKQLEDATVKQTVYLKLLDILNGSVSAIFGLVLFVLAGFLVSKGEIPIGVLLVVGNFRFYLNSGIKSITSARGAMKGSHALIGEVAASAAPVAVKENTKQETPATIKTSGLALQFSNGEKLSYPDLTIRQGEKILLTGDSGAGKSTLFKLILGGLKPSSGKVIFENKAGQVINPDLSKIGYIPQDPVVFPASMQDNITMFNNHLDDQVGQIVKEVNFADDIAKFKDGLNEELNLDKLNISGGQRQKIVLARAKIHDSDIILIDEGTSAIDQAATMNILQRLVKSQATIVFIAHNFNEGMRQLFDREIHLVKE